MLRMEGWTLGLKFLKRQRHGSRCLCGGTVPAADTLLSVAASYCLGFLFWLPFIFLAFTMCIKPSAYILFPHSSGA